MAKENGESVAFSCAYAGNLRDIADYLQVYKKAKNTGSIPLLKELEILLSKENEDFFDDPEKCRSVLFEYMRSVSACVSGEKQLWSVDDICERLSSMSSHLMDRIRKNEWITDDDSGWFNSYYDNSKRKVEGILNDSGSKKVRMMLTGQVFSVMSGTARENEIKDIIKSADRYLYDENIGGYRLNTDFKELKTDLGRMFGFAYGEKENGAVFSHMAVMYANALYQRGFGKEGFKALDTLYRASSNYKQSKIYPGIPEYFNNEGRGLYHYLTGAGSWYLLTVITEMFGIRGNAGSLHIEPKLMNLQFDKDGAASVDLPFAGCDISVRYINRFRKEFGEYQIGTVTADADISFTAEQYYVEIPVDELKKPDPCRLVIEIELV